MTHWHAVNESLSPDDAALCVYPTRARARNMMNVWLRGAQAFKWAATPVGATGWNITSTDKSVTYIDVKACEDTACKVVP
jgi:hypothetical protein